MYHTSFVWGGLQYHDGLLKLAGEKGACTYKERYCDLVGVWPAVVEACDCGPSIDVNPKGILCHTCMVKRYNKSEIELRGAWKVIPIR